MLLNTQDVISLCGIKYRTLNHWIVDGVVVPYIKGWQKRPSLFTPQQVIGLAFVAAYRDVRGCHTEFIRDVDESYRAMDWDKLERQIINKLTPIERLQKAPRDADDVRQEFAREICRDDHLTDEICFRVLKVYREVKARMEKRVEVEA